MLWKYTTRYLRKHQKQTFMQIIFIVLMLVLMLEASIYASYNSAKKTIEDQNANGIWQLCFHDVEDVEEAKQYPHVLEYIVGMDSEDEKIAFLEGDYENVLSYHLKEGRFAKNEKEIVVSQKRLEELNIEPVLNSEITLEFGTYTLVGISEYIPTRANKHIYPNYLVCPQAYESLNLYLGGQKNRTLVDKYREYSYEIQPEHFSILDRYKTSVTFSENSMLLKHNIYFISQMFVISILSLILMMNYTYANLSHRSHDYVLLRGIGALKKQLAGMSLIETTILFVIALPISFMIAFFSAYIISTNQSIVPLEKLLLPGLLTMNVFLGYFIVLCANYFPVYRAINNALTGEFNAQEVKIISKPKRKLKRLTFFELAKIKVMTHKRSYLFMMIIMVSMMCSVLYSLDIHFDTKEMNQNIESYLSEPFVLKRDMKNLTRDELIKEDFTYETIEAYLTDFEHIFKVGKEYFDPENTNTILVAPLNQSIIEMSQNFEIKGRMPEAEDEVLLLSQSYSYISNLGTNVIYVDGTSAYIHGKEYKIVGQIVPLEYLKYNYDATEFMNFFAFPMSSPMIVFMDPSQVNSSLGQLEEDTLIQYHGGPIHNQKVQRITKKALEPLYDSKNIIKIRDDELQINVICVAALLFMMYFFTQTQKRNQMKEDNNNFLRLGFTKSEIMKIYQWESLMINGLGAIISLVIAVFSFKLIINVTSIAVTFILFMIFMLTYLIPVRNTLKKKNESIWKSF